MFIIKCKVTHAGPLSGLCFFRLIHYDDVIMEAIASQITSLTTVYSTVHSGGDQSKHQSCASLAFVWGIHRGPVNSPHKRPVTRKMFPFDDVIMIRGKKVFNTTIKSHCKNAIAYSITNLFKKDSYYDLFYALFTSPVSISIHHNKLS